ncbi:hypothetical protein [Azospirillum baldaniorum]|uniref:hypothetical protein n=1 Tax=Azospirillum baldaniorum TaxID=1064539 RepID=UPI00117E5CF3|nr:hypothetical protein [Azospirillum baldaniorum]
MEHAKLEYLLRRNQDAIARARDLVEESQRIRAARRWNRSRLESWAKCFDRSITIGDKDRHTTDVLEQDPGKPLASSHSGRR